MEIQVTHVTDLVHCDEVFALYRSESATLGFMPKGAFEEGILNKRLLVAFGVSKQVIGYLLYRLVQRRASISHLCVKREARGKGIAERLVMALKDHTLGLDGIMLRCRGHLCPRPPMSAEDYDAEIKKRANEGSLRLPWRR